MPPIRDEDLEKMVEIATELSKGAIIAASRMMKPTLPAEEFTRGLALTHAKLTHVLVKNVHKDVLEEILFLCAMAYSAVHVREERLVRLRVFANALNTSAGEELRRILDKPLGE